MKVTPIP